MSQDHDLLIRIDTKLSGFLTNFDGFKGDILAELKDHNRRLNAIEEWPSKNDTERRIQEHDALYRDFSERRASWKWTLGGWKGLMSILTFVAMLVTLVLNLMKFR